MQKLIYHHYNQFSPPFSPLFQRKHIAFYHHRKATKKVKSEFRPFEKLSHSWKERKPLESSEKTFTLRSVFFIFPLSEWRKTFSMSWITICLTKDERRRFLSRSSVVLCRRTMKLSCWPRIYVYKSKINSRYINYSNWKNK